MSYFENKKFETVSIIYIPKPLCGANNAIVDSYFWADGTQKSKIVSIPCIQFDYIPSLAILDDLLLVVMPT